MIDKIKLNKSISGAGILIPALFLILLSSQNIQAQKEDNVWVMGYTYFRPDTIDVDTLMGGIFFDFNELPVNIYAKPDQYMNFREMTSSMSDEEGELLYFTNGMSIHNADFEALENGDTICYGDYWEHWNIELENHKYKNGLAILQGALSLPWPEEEGKYLLLYQEYDLEMKGIDHQYYAVIDMNVNDGKGKVLEKDIDLIDPGIPDSLCTGYGMLSACRHANGRDWWLLLPYTEKNKIRIYLFDPSGIHQQQEYILT